MGLERRELYLIALLLINLALLAKAGSTPGGYPPQEGSPYPIREVLLTATVMLAELALFWAVLRPRTYHRSWRRALLAALLFVPWGLICITLIMHMPGYIIAHAFWASLLGLVSVALLGVSGTAAIRSARREGAA